MMYYKPTPLFRADVRKIAHGLIIRTIRYTNIVNSFQYLLLCMPCMYAPFSCRLLTLWFDYGCLSEVHTMP